MKIKAEITGTNYVGIRYDEEIEVEDDATDEEIENEVWEWAVAHMAIETDWEKIEDNQ